MERLKLKLKKAQKALTSLKEILKEPYSIYIRDATIQRFEYTFEAFWKYLKEYIKITKGANVTFPKDCFREIFRAELCNEDEASELLKMTDSRNETSHTYNEEVANDIYSKTKGYAELMDKVLSKVKA